MSGVTLIVPGRTHPNSQTALRGAPVILSAPRALTATSSTFFAVRDYDLAATLTSGQAFRWRLESGGWMGVIDSHWVRLQTTEEGIRAEAAEPLEDWQWLADYLQISVCLGHVLSTFPDDEPMRTAVTACRGLRLLRQDPWECLASFILSSTKQIVQIQQIVAQVCACFGEPAKVPAGQAPAFGFPSATRLAQVSEAELRGCKMGFRAPYLLTAARKVASGQLDLYALRQMPVNGARAQLMDLPGVGRKIADCVLLFAYGVQSSFPVDIWVMKALRQLYFRGRKANLKRLQRFTENHFGPNAGYAQQYLFHYFRTKSVQRR
jgi:N-glycosylase/DNA lyase